MTTVDSNEYQRLSERLDRYLLKEDFNKSHGDFKTDMVDRINGVEQRLTERIVRAESADSSMRTEFSSKLDALSTQFTEMKIMLQTIASNQKVDGSKRSADWWKFTATALISILLSSGGLLGVLSLAHLLR